MLTGDVVFGLIAAVFFSVFLFLGCSSVSVVQSNYSEVYKTEFEALLQEQLPDGYSIDVLIGPRKNVDITGYGVNFSERNNWGPWYLDLSWTFMTYKNLDMNWAISDGSATTQSEISFLMSSSGLEVLGGYALGSHLLRLGARRVVFTMTELGLYSEIGSINIAQNLGVVGYEYVVPTKKGSGFYLRGDYGVGLQVTEPLESASMTSISIGYFW